MKPYLTKTQVDEWNIKYKDFLDSINIGFMLVAQDYTVYEANHTFLEMVGAAAEELRFVNIRDFYPSDEFQTVFDYVETIEKELKQKKTADEKKNWTFEYFWYHHRTGEKIPMLFTGAVNINEKGFHDTTYLTCTDLRDYKQIQKALVQEKNKLEAILFSIGDCVSIFDERGEFIYGNRQGVEVQKHRKNSIIDMVSDEENEFDLTLNRRKFKFKGRAKALYDNEGEIFAYAEILKDITSQKKLKEQGKELTRMKREMARIGLQSQMVGVSRSMREIFDLIIRCAAVDSTVLVLGETGVGKEMVAREICNQSSRCKKPFIAINCGALPESLLESELFGHAKGAFTGATTDRKGLFREAENGTLFLDEIGDLSPALQVKLLRVLQDHKVRPIGGNKTHHVDVRIIAATHRNLNQMMEQDDYRKDLYYRLAVIPITVPPLRERKEDILPLVEHFISKHNRKKRGQSRTLDHPAQQCLMSYPWPGNIRELENCIEYALAMSNKKVITPSNLPVQVVHPPQVPECPSTESVPAVLNTPTQQSEMPDSGIVRLQLKPWELEAKLEIEQALISHKGNRTKTSKALGVSRGTLWRKISLYKIDL